MVVVVEGVEVEGVGRSDRSVRGGRGVDGVQEIMFLMFHHLFNSHVVARPERLGNGIRRTLVKRISCS